MRMRIICKTQKTLGKLRIFQLSHIILHSYQSVQCVCVCVCVCLCVCVCVCVTPFKKNKKTIITFSISMYIMCVCLFSALSHRVGALQMSIIIITDGAMAIHFCLRLLDWATDHAYCHYYPGVNQAQELIMVLLPCCRLLMINTGKTLMAC